MRVDRSRRLRLLLPAAWLVFGLAGLSAAPAAPQPSSPAFGETIDVRVVNVEVVVTDRKGERVRGLGAGDFELLVDGSPVPVDYFTEDPLPYTPAR